MRERLRASWPLMIVLTAVAAGSLLPWYTVQTRTGSAPGVPATTDTWSASAWTAATSWAAAVALVLAALTAALVWQVVRGPIPRGPRTVLAAVPLLAGALVIRRWQSIGPGGSPADPVWSVRLEVSVGDSSPAGRPRIVRDQLSILHTGGIDMDVGFGMYLSLLVFLVAAVTLLWFAYRPGRGPAPDG